MVYDIDENNFININHVVRVEKNARFNSILFSLANGQSAERRFNTLAQMENELARIKSIIGGE